MTPQLPVNPEDANLLQAVREGNLEQARRAVDAGANVNASDENGAGTLLCFEPAMLEYLLQQGADPNQQTNEFGSCILAGHCYVNAVECVRLLLRYGADPDRGRLESGETPLHHAVVFECDPELVRLLIAHGADVHARTRVSIVSHNFYGETPTRGESVLHRAAAYQSREVVELLIAAGADRTATDDNGHLPFHWAGWHQRDKPFVEYLRPG